jgi:hypothetical protein
VIVPLDECGPEAAAGGIEDDPGAGDSATDHQEVPALRRERRQVLPAGVEDRGHGRRATDQPDQDDRGPDHEDADEERAEHQRWTSDGSRLVPKASPDDPTTATATSRTAGQPTTARSATVGVRRDPDRGHEDPAGEPPHAWSAARSSGGGR